MASTHPASSRSTTRFFTAWILQKTTTSPSPYDVPYQLQLHTYLRTSAIYDVFRATITSSDDRALPSHIHAPDGNVMVKIMATHTFFGVEYYIEEPRHESVLEAVYCEAAIHQECLSKSKRKVSPEFYGLFVQRSPGSHADWKSQVVVMVLEDVTQPIHRHLSEPFAYIKDDLR